MTDRTRAPMLESQIEIMLDKLIDENEDEGELKFSDDDDEEEEESEGKKEKRIINPALTYEQSNNNDFEKLSLHREHKRYPTYQYPIQFQQYGFGFHNLQTQMNQVHNQNYGKKNNFSSHFSTGSTNVTSPTLSNNHLGLIPTFNNSNSNISSFGPHNRNSNMNLQNPKNGYHRNDKKKGGFEGNFGGYIYNTVKPNYNYRQNNGFGSFQFYSTPNPKIANTEKLYYNSEQLQTIQIEMLLYELSNALEKSEKIDYYIYSKLQGNFIKVIKTHKGSRIFQNYLKNTHSDIIHQIFTEIIPSLNEIISDSYANYFCKRFFNYLNQKDRVQFLVTIKDSLIKLSMDSIGTYPIQGIVEEVGSKIEKNIIVSNLIPAVAELCYNTYGTHVLEKIICCFEDEFTGFIYDYVSNNFLQLTNNINGICVVKKILTLTHKKELHEKLKKMSFENALSLIQHPYGNHVIQVIFENWEDSEVKLIASQFKGKFVFLSMQKYSSNVVERCIEKSECLLEEYINEICNSDRIAEVMKNNFGNYVIQTSLRLSKGLTKKFLAETVNKNIIKLNDKKLISKWKSIVAPHLECPI